MEAAVADMEHRDTSAPDTPQDFVDQKTKDGHTMKVASPVLGGKVRERATVLKKHGKELPTLLDFLTLGLESGQNLGGAIRLTLAKAPRGALRLEFARVFQFCFREPEKYQDGSG